MAANFGLTPSAAHDGVLDYTTVAHAKIYSEAIKPVEPAFDCTAGGLKVFLSRIADKATGYGWTAILEVPQDVAHPDDDLMNILTEYGRISIQQVRDHVETYLTNESRAAQESMQLYMCLKASLTKEGEATIMLQADSFTVDNVQSGVLLLKVIINESYIDTNATTRTIRDNLAALDIYMVAIESDITALCLIMQQFTPEERIANSKTGCGCGMEFFFCTCQRGHQNGIRKSLFGAIWCRDSKPTQSESSDPTRNMLWPTLPTIFCCK